MHHFGADHEPTTKNNSVIKAKIPNCRRQYQAMFLIELIIYCNLRKKNNHNLTKGILTNHN